MREILKCYANSDEVEARLKYSNDLENIVFMAKIWMSR